MPGQVKNGKNGRVYCVIEGENNVKGIGLDQDVQQLLLASAGAERDRGICNGITSGWIMGFLANVQDAKSPQAFADYFENLLRPQAGYMKALNTGGRVDYYSKKIGFDLKKVKELKTAELKLQHCPKEVWAAYVALWGHAIGIAADNAKYYYMDPNYGLAVLQTGADFLTLVNDYIKMRRKQVQNPAAGKGYAIDPWSEGLFLFYTA